MAPKGEWPHRSRCGKSHRNRFKTRRIRVRRQRLGWISGNGTTSPCGQAAAHHRNNGGPPHL